jgi:REP element-mobilizing transposase RayT
MSLPRPILPGRIYLITRRCAQRQFLLRPDDKTNQAFLYCLAEAAHRFGIELIGWLAMSNHYHAVVHDPNGRLPDFACHFHQMLAKCLNVRWSRWENLWSSEPPAYTLLTDPSDVFDKLLYTLLNPVADRLVEAVSHWPGASSWSLIRGRELTIERPSFFFRRRGVMPEKVTLRISVPSSVALDDVEWLERVREAVCAREQEIRATRLARREPLLGRKAVLAACAFESPTTPAARRELRPFVACRNLWHRVCALDALQRFRVAYRAARLAFVRGFRDVVFPAGTFALRRLGITCRDAPAEAGTTH